MKESPVRTGADYPILGHTSREPLSPARARLLRAFKISCSLAVLCLGGLLARAQSWAIPWHCIDAGGGKSTGGIYSVAGAIGQSDAGLLKGGIFTLKGGFQGWVAAVLTEGAPHLNVTCSNAIVVVSWIQPTPGWNLEFATELAGGPASWRIVPPPYLTNGIVCTIQQPRRPGNMFYRLHKP